MAKNDTNIPFQRFDRLATFILSNLAWMVFALPIITIPLGTVGVFQVMSHWARGKQPEFFTHFFGAVRKYWWKASLIGLIDVVVGSITFANLTLFTTLGFDNPLILLAGTMNIFVAIIVLMTNMYVWSLLVVAEFSLRHTTLLSLKLVFANLIETTVILILAVLPIVLTIGLSLPAFLWFVGLVSLSILIVNMGTWRVIRRYLPESELLIFESNDSEKY